MSAQHRGRKVEASTHPSISWRKNASKSNLNSPSTPSTTENNKERHETVKLIREYKKTHAKIILKKKKRPAQRMPVLLKGNVRHLRCFNRHPETARETAGGFNQLPSLLMVKVVAFFWGWETSHLFFWNSYNWYIKP